MNVSHVGDCTLSPKEMILFLILPIRGALIKYWLKGCVKGRRS